jgi:putative DNA primase/helicase
MLDVREVARALDGETSGRNVLVPGPGHSRTDRSLSILIDPGAPDGFIVHSFAGDDPIKCRDYVKTRLGLAGQTPQPRASKTPRQRAPARLSADNTPRALEIFMEARPIEGTIAMTHLASRRILELPPDVHEVLRFHPRCPYHRGEHHPCLVALMRDVVRNRPQAIHRTALTPEGKKLESARALGPSGGAAIKVWPDEDAELSLIVGEGLETTLAAAMNIEHRGTLLRPAWALGSAGNLASFSRFAWHRGPDDPGRQ